MTERRRKKNSRQRAGTTHGWGSMKKHRGKGNKGGAGMAGTGKRGDGKKPVVWKNKKYFGKHGFKKKGQVKKVVIINIDTLERELPKLLAAKKITQEGEMYKLDLPSLGYTKLLGKGNVSHKLHITVDSASPKAVEKITSGGGQVITP